jgi:flagellar biogenesis protein FliO
MRGQQKPGRAQEVTFMEKTQTFQNHTKFFPFFHFFAVPLLFTNLIWAIVRLVRHLSGPNIQGLILALGVVALAFAARLMALTVQDRVIRLEMRVRMAGVLPADLRARIPEFTVSQLVALRFASDAELPELSRKVLQEKLNDRTAIKKMIRDWQPDFVRA